jgi:hypothetical protein
MEEWIKLRDETFADDRASRWLVAEMFNIMGRWDETARRFPDEYRSLATSLIALGRNEELLASPWAVIWERVTARMAMGDVDRLLDSNDLEPAVRADLLCKAGRAAEAARIQPYPAQLYLGGGEDLLAREAPGPRRNAILMALGRYEEAAGTDLPDVPAANRSISALLLLGRLDEAEKLKADTRLYRLLGHLAAERIEEAKELREGVRFGRNRSCYSGWFGQGPGAGLIDVALGDGEALRKALEQGAKITSGWGGRSALVCAAALDPAKDAAVSAMPWRTEAGAWLLIAQALRAELANDRVAALAAWRAYAALPPMERLLEDQGPSVEIEAFAAWRRAVLAQEPAP